MGMESTVQGILPAQPVSTVSPTFLRGVGFSFLLAVPLILLVFSTFLVGGNVQTLVCQSWENGELYEVGLPSPRAQRDMERDMGRAGGSEGSLEPEGARG